MNEKEYIITVDLGTTLIKCIIYDNKLIRAADCSIKFTLKSENRFVEFDPDEYWNYLKTNLKKLIDASGINPEEVKAIGLSGQAETFVLLDKDNKPLRPAISWLDQRSKIEVDEISNVFGDEEGFRVTGQLKVTTTWTATKLLWIRKNEPDIYKKIKKILLLKDYIAFKFTGLFFSEYTTYNYSYYFDIFKKCYWEGMLSYIGISTEKLPVLVEPGKNIGKISLENIRYFNFSKGILLNIGANDQFAGMVGVGNFGEGIISESTGTTLTIATMVNINNLKKIRMPIHYNAIKDTYVYLMTSDSGGICLEWLKNNFFKDLDYKELDILAGAIEKGSEGLIFMPYLVGVNSPEFDLNTTGGFLGAQIYHKEPHFIRAVMEGIAFLIRKNMRFLEKNNINTKNVISMGGGSKSSLWNQIKADITGKNIVVTSENDPVCLGLAILMALELNYYNNLEEITVKILRVKEEYIPDPGEKYEQNYDKFVKFYDFLKDIN